MSRGVGVDGVAVALLQPAMDIGEIAEFMEVVVAVLRCGERPVDAASVDAHGCSGFHSCGCESGIAQLLGDAV